VRISFNSNALDSTTPAPKGLLDALGSKLGPDGAVLSGEWQFVKPGKGVSFVRAEWHLEFSTKVRSQVVARWMVTQFKDLDLSILRGGIDYKSDEAALTQLIEDESVTLPDRTPKPPEPYDGEGAAETPGS